MLVWLGECTTCVMLWVLRRVETCYIRTSPFTKTRLSTNNYGSCKGMDMASRSTQVVCDICWGAQSRYRKRPPHHCTISSSLNWWYEVGCFVATIHHLPSKCCCKNRDSPDQETLSQSSAVQYYWSCVNCSFLFLAHRSCARCNFKHSPKLNENGGN